MTTRFDELRQHFESHLDHFGSRHYPQQWPEKQTGEVVAYILKGRGKRVRPLLTMLAAEACGGSYEKALPAAAAVELVHTYSLVHDDLPCMDNDDFRRGVPTAHKAFNESRALLAGDGILTDAFTLLAHDSQTALNAEARLKLIGELGNAAGTNGMVLGQALDLYWTGRGGASRADLDEVHRRKTGLLIGAACAMGAITASANEATVNCLREFGLMIGLAFQITDDLLDDSAATGKTAGKDKVAGKLTYLATMSEHEARAAASSYTRQAEQLLRDQLGDRTEALLKFSALLLARQH